MIYKSCSLFDSGVKCFVGGAICRKAEGGERHPIAGVPLVSVLSPLVFLTAGGLSGLSTPNSCWLLAPGPHWLCAWPNGASAIFKYRSSVTARGDIITLSFIVSMCVYMKNCVLCFDKRMEQMLMHPLSVFKTTECVFFYSIAREQVHISMNNQHTELRKNSFHVKTIKYYCVMDVISFKSCQRVPL